MARTGASVLLDVLRTEGVTHVFGNPGSTELPLIDALATADDLRYVLALQEASVVAMAEGYAQATGRPAFVNLHTMAGTGNGMGALTNARANGSPLVVTAGQADFGHIEVDPLLSGDLESLARPIAKWSHELRVPRELGTIMRRAFHDAASAPSGPVFVSLPMSMLDEEGDWPLPAASRIERASGPGGALDALVDQVRSAPAGSLALVLGDEAAGRGWPPLVALAEALGAPVYGSPLYGRAPFPLDHPLWQGSLGIAATAIRAQLAPFRTVLLLGGQAFMVYPFSDGSPLPEGTELVHVCADAAMLGRAHPTALGVVADPGTAAAALAARLADAPVAGAAEALAAAVAAAPARETNRIETARSRYGDAPLHPEAAVHAALAALPPDTCIVDEAITTGGFVRRHGRPADPGAYLFNRGGGLGWGMPAACGVALGHDRKRPVLCVVGDGSALYSPQALWTAAREQLPVVFLVVDNGQYAILKGLLRGRKGPSVETGNFVAMDLGAPTVDHAGLAAAFGCDAHGVGSTDELHERVAAAAASGRPTVLHVPILPPS